MLRPSRESFDEMLALFTIGDCLELTFFKSFDDIVTLLLCALDLCEYGSSASQ